MGAVKSDKSAREEKQRMTILKMKFENRITIAKFGKAALDNNDYGGAIKKFLEYLNILAEIKKCANIYALRTTHFDPKKDITEMFMISHVYLELARIYDAIPQYDNDCKQCLEQFVHFTANQPFQVVNSEMIRRKIRKGQFRNMEGFRDAYKQIFVQSKKCFVVTYCYGDTHSITQQCREFKSWLLKHSLGQELVRLYYSYSSTIIERFGHYRSVKWLGQFFIRPFLMVFAKMILPLILK